MIALVAALALADDPERGRWAARQVVSSQVDDPNPFSRSGWATVATTGWSVIDWERDGTVLTATDRVCDVATTVVLGTTTIYPPAFVAALNGPPRIGTIDGDRLTLAWTSQLGPDDDDGDGLPGVTVEVRQSMLGQGKVWVEQSSSTRWEGVRAGAGWRGTVATTTRQTVLDGERWWLKLQTKSRPDPDPSHSFFELVPFDGDCDALLRARGTLFPG